MKPVPVPMSTTILPSTMAETERVLPPAFSEGNPCRTRSRSRVTCPVPSVWAVSAFAVAKANFRPLAPAGIVVSSPALQMVQQGIRAPPSARHSRSIPRRPFSLIGALFRTWLTWFDQSSQPPLQPSITTQVAEQDGCKGSPERFGVLNRRTEPRVPLGGAAGLTAARPVCRSG